MEKVLLIQQIQTILFEKKSKIIKHVESWLRYCPKFAEFMEKNILLHSKEELIEELLSVLDIPALKKLARKRYENMSKQDLAVCIFSVIGNSRSNISFKFTDKIYGSLEDRLQVFSDQLPDYNTGQLHVILKDIEGKEKLSTDKLV